MRPEIAIGAFILGVLLLSWFLTKDKRFERLRAKRRTIVEEQCRIVPRGETIFVSIASYRDPECGKTINDLFEKAFCPFRIHVGVCQQNHQVDNDVLNDYEKFSKKGLGTLRDNIRIKKLRAEEAKGPMFARHVIEHELYKGEAYVLVIDSHMRFVKHWDRELISALSRCNSSKPILTTYPDDFNWSDKEPQISDPPAYFRATKFDPQNASLLMEGVSCYRRPVEPMPTPFIAPGFYFTFGHFFNEVPTDKEMEYVFFGEDSALSARAYTHGWDAFVPDVTVVQHMWTRRRPTFWEHLWGDTPIHRERQKARRRGYRRLRCLLRTEAKGPNDSLNIYDLGKVRTLKQFETWSGVHFALQTLDKSALLGVSNDPTREEILCKFGSLSTYKKAIKELG